MKNVGIIGRCFLKSLLHASHPERYHLLHPPVCRWYITEPTRSVQVLWCWYFFQASHHPPEAPRGSQRSYSHWETLGRCILALLPILSWYLHRTNWQATRIEDHKSSAPGRITSAVRERTCSTEAYHTINWDNLKILGREDREFPPSTSSKGGHLNKETLNTYWQSTGTKDWRSPQSIMSFSVIIWPKIIKGQRALLHNYIIGILLTRMCLHIEIYYVLNDCLNYSVATFESLCSSLQYDTKTFNWPRC